MSPLQLEGLFIPICGIQFLSCRSYVNLSCAPWNGYLLSHFICIFHVLLDVQSLEKLENLPNFDLCL